MCQKVELAAPRQGRQEVHAQAEGGKWDIHFVLVLMLVQLVLITTASPQCSVLLEQLAIVA